MIVSVDTSALAKLLVEEVESAVMREYLADGIRDQFVISTVAVTELRRLAIQVGRRLPERVSWCGLPGTVRAE